MTELGIAVFNCPATRELRGVLFYDLTCDNLVRCRSGGAVLPAVQVTAVVDRYSGSYGSCSSLRRCSVIWPGRLTGLPLVLRRSGCGRGCWRRRRARWRLVRRSFAVSVAGSDPNPAADGRACWPRCGRTATRAWTSATAGGYRPPGRAVSHNDQRLDAAWAPSDEWWFHNRFRQMATLPAQTAQCRSSTRSTSCSSGRRRN
jgi:hypothetical protein